MFESLSLTGRQWRLRELPAGHGAALASALGVSQLSGEVFAGRQLDTGFFQSSASALLDPAGMKGVELALTRLQDARLRREKIRLVTDYDVDGTTSCLVLHAALDRLGGADISYHIPDRFTEGYGLSRRAVETAAADGVRLIVTADIGVRDHATVSFAKSLGVEVIVCDHHLPLGEAVPADALAVLCPPQAGCGYANKALAACGVSLKLATALLADDPRREDILGSMLKLSAIGTVADIVDLATPENRAIVSLGLARLNGDRHGAGLAALLEVSGVRPGEIDAGTLGWRIGPRINAAGRLADANAVVRLLRERDPASARAQAALLDELNRERQDVQARLFDIVCAAVPTTPPPFLVLAGPESEGYHRGVVGIVAAKVRERFNRPTAIVSVSGLVATGSIRSVPAIHATHALDAAGHLLHRYGGHAAAAGFSIDTASLPQLEASLHRYVAEHGGDDALVVEEWVDAVVSPGQVTPQLVAELSRLEPCGKGNEKPRVVVNSRATEVRVLKEKHLSFRLGSIRALWWNAAERAGLLNQATAFLGQPSLNTYKGNTTAELVVDDIA